MEIKDRILLAIRLAIQRHPALEGKAFKRTNAGGWSLSPNILYADYSSTEAMLTGPIVEMVFEAYGSAFIKVRPDTLAKDLKPSQLIWFWSPGFYEVIHLLDAEQKDILMVLIKN